MNSFRTGLWVTASVLAGLAAAVPAQAQKDDQAEVLLEAAKHKALADGDLQAAIELCEKIVAEHNGNRPTAAKALVHMGLCYEKLGNAKAQQAYERVLKEYADQPVLVTQARTLLAALRERTKRDRGKPTFRKIRIASNPGNGVLSPDGSKLAFTSESSLWVVPVHGKVDPDIAGEPVRLTKPMGAFLGNMLAWSADGNWIAFNGKAGEEHAIYVIPSAGGEPKRIPGNHHRGSHVYFYRLSLSPDGGALTYTVYKAPEQRDQSEQSRSDMSIYTIPVGGSDAKLLVEGRSSQPAFSPDGRLVAYIKQGELRVIPATGGSPVLVARPSRRARGPVWSPDGKTLAFIREPGGDNLGTEIWIVPVSDDGKPIAAPTKIPLPRKSFDLLAGWTTAGKIGVFMNTPSHNAIYTVPATGGKAVQITPNGWAFHPRWTPDGKRIIFRGKGLVSVPAEGGEVSPIATKIWPALPGGGCHVSPDGKTILYSAATKICTVPTQGGEPTQITSSPTQDRFPCWSPDGQSIAFLRGLQKSKGQYSRMVYVVPARGGQPKPITTEAHGVAYAAIAYSPDAKWLAYFSDKAVNVMPAEGGESRVVTDMDVVPDSHAELAWSPDGKQIAYTGRGRIWAVPLEGGQPAEIKTGVLTEVSHYVHIDWSPDGKKIVFCASMGGEAELYLMENFLPEPEAEASRASQ